MSLNRLKKEDFLIDEKGWIQKDTGWHRKQKKESAIKNPKIRVKIEIVECEDKQVGGPDWYHLDKKCKEHWRISFKLTAWCIFHPNRWNYFSLRLLSTLLSNHFKTTTATAMVAVNSWCRWSQLYLSIARYSAGTNQTNNREAVRWKRWQVFARLKHEVISWWAWPVPVSSSCRLATYATQQKILHKMFRDNLLME